MTTLSPRLCEGIIYGDPLAVGAEGVGMTEDEHFICVQGEDDLAQACLDIVRSPEARGRLARMAAAARSKGLTTQNRAILKDRLAFAFGL